MADTTAGVRPAPQADLLAILDLAEAKARGALLAVVICGHLDAPKRAMLAGAGYGVASEWHTRTL